MEPDQKVDELSTDTKLLIICSMFLMFSASFVLCWRLAYRYIKKFQDASLAVKADNCSRWNSTLHALIVFPGLMVGILTMDWDDNYRPIGPVNKLQGVLCVTIAYFFCDAIPIVLYRVPMWPVFVIHHIVACTPYVVYMFVMKCPDGLYVLATMMLVEFSNLSLNSQVWLEQFNLRNSIWYTIAFYTTFVGWIVFRTVNPIFDVWVIHARLFPTMPASRKRCLYVSLGCAYLIIGFCLYVFIAVVCKEMWLRWRKPAGRTSFDDFGGGPEVPLNEEEIVELEEGHRVAEAAK